jgi:DNA-binding CsgD family transcriptional regulator
MMILPMHGTGEDGSHNGALLFVFDPEAAPTVTADLLQRLFGFTSAEGELAVALCAGSSPEEIASERDRSISTIRNQIRSLYEKTGARRQSDLIGLLLASPAYFIAKEHTHARKPEDSLSRRPSRI